jgi:hypothetical protein
MQIDSELWMKRQWDVLISFIHHMAYQRVLGKAYSESGLKSQFWRHSIDAHLIRAILNWCIVFGNDSNEFHWKRVVVDENAQSACRRSFLKGAGLSEEKWKTFWTSMTDFRNKYVAHRDPPYTPVPMMEVPCEWFSPTTNG